MIRVYVRVRKGSVSRAGVHTFMIYVQRTIYCTEREGERQREGGRDREGHRETEREGHRETEREG